MIRVAWWAWLLLVGGFCVAFAASVEHPHLVPASVWWCLGAVLGALVTWVMSPDPGRLAEELAEARDGLNSDAIIAQHEISQSRRELGELRSQVARVTAENKVLVTELALARSGVWRVGPGGVS